MKITPTYGQSHFRQLAKNQSATHIPEFLRGEGIAAISSLALERRLPDAARLTPRLRAVAVTDSAD